MTRIDWLRNTPVAQFLRQAMEDSGKTVAQITAELGRESGVSIQFLVAGVTKLQLTKIKPVAQALGVDPAHLLRFVLASYYPGLNELIEELIGKPGLSPSERRLIDALRRHTDGTGGEAIVADARDLIAVVMV